MAVAPRPIGTLPWDGWKYCNQVGCYVQVTVYAEFCQHHAAFYSFVYKAWR